eukprot:9930945-Prorocentrum_lima.AAC.1
MSKHKKPPHFPNLVATTSSAPFASPTSTQRVAHKDSMATPSTVCPDDSPSFAKMGFCGGQQLPLIPNFP